jgi:hypothetical protein
MQIKIFYTHIGLYCACWVSTPITISFYTHTHTHTHTILAHFTVSMEWIHFSITAVCVCVRTACMCVCVCSKQSVPDCTLPTSRMIFRVAWVWGGKQSNRLSINFDKKACNKTSHPSQQLFLSQMNCFLWCTINQHSIWGKYPPCVCTMCSHSGCTDHSHPLSHNTMVCTSPPDLVGVPVRVPAECWLLHGHVR